MFQSSQLKGKNVVALMTFYFKDSLVENVNNNGEKDNLNSLPVNHYKAFLEEKLSFMVKKDINKIMMLNIPDDSFLGLDNFKSEKILEKQSRLLRSLKKIIISFKKRKNNWSKNMLKN